MLLALWPLFFPRPFGHSGGTIDADITHRRIDAPEVIPKTPAMLAADEHVRRLQSGAVDGRNTRSGLDSGSLPDSNIGGGIVAARVLRQEPIVGEWIPAASAPGVLAGDAIPPELATAMRQAQLNVRIQLDEDEEIAMMLILRAMR